MNELSPSLSLEQVEPLLAKPLSDDQRPRAEALVDVFTSLLQARYGQALSLKWESVSRIVAALVASGVSRKLAKVNELATQESAGPFSVSWSSDSTSGSWFLPGELSWLDQVLGKGGTRSVRTPAPDAIRRLNRMTRFDAPSGTVTLGGIEVETNDVYPW